MVSRPDGSCTRGASAPGAEHVLQRELGEADVAAGARRGGQVRLSQLAVEHLLGARG